MQGARGMQDAGGTKNAGCIRNVGAPGKGACKMQWVYRMQDASGAWKNRRFMERMMQGAVAHRMQDVRAMKNAGERGMQGAQRIRIKGHGEFRMKHAGVAWNAAGRWCMERSMQTAHEMKHVECRGAQNAKCWDAGIYFLQKDNSLNDQFLMNHLFLTDLFSHLFVNH